MHTRVRQLSSTPLSLGLHAGTWLRDPGAGFYHSSEPYRNGAMPTVVSSEIVSAKPCRGTRRRYDRELVNGHWSAVRRVIDGRPPHSLVLRVASVWRPADAVVEPEPAAAEVAATRASALLLTDGWHAILAAIDDGLQELVKLGSIRVGLSSCHPPTQCKVAAMPGGWPRLTLCRHVGVAHGGTYMAHTVRVYGIQLAHC
jgi:hypothetical protein